jgi:hypothetical protein
MVVAMRGRTTSMAVVASGRTISTASATRASATRASATRGRTVSTVVAGRLDGSAAGVRRLLIPTRRILSGRLGLTTALSCRIPLIKDAVGGPIARFVTEASTVVVSGHCESVCENDSRAVGGWVEGEMLW